MFMPGCKDQETEAFRHPDRPGRQGQKENNENGEAENRHRPAGCRASGTSDHFRAPAFGRERCVSERKKQRAGHRISMRRPVRRRVATRGPGIQRDRCGLEASQR